MVDAVQAGRGVVDYPGIYPIPAGTVLANLTADVALPAAYTVAELAAYIGTPVYQGTWNASTNTPALASSVGTNGNYYVVSVAGTTSLNGISDWSVGDWVIFNGTANAWQKIEGGATTITNGTTAITGSPTANGLAYNNAGVFAINANATVTSAGAAALASVAIGGATIGSNALAVTGSSALASVAIGGATLGGNALAVTGSALFNGVLAFAGTTNNGLQVNSLTTAQKNALTGVAGNIVYDSTLTRIQGYDGATWHSWLRTDGDTMTGVLTMPNGLVGTPSFNLGDSTTGLYRPGANQLAVAVSGTGIAAFYAAGVNLAASLVLNWGSGALGSSVDTQIGRSAAGILTINNSSTNSIRFGATGAGIAILTNAAGDDFSRLQLGGTTASFPAIKRSSTAAAFRLGDDSGDAPITAASLTTTGGGAFTITQANSVSPTSPNRTITISLAGTTYYLAAKTTND